MSYRPPSDSSFAFDDAGERVPTVGFQYPDDGDAEASEADTARAWGEGFLTAIGLLNSERRPGKAGCAAAGRDLAVLAHVLLDTGETQRQLAEKLGASPALVSAKLNHARRTLAALAKGKTRIASRETERRAHR